MKSRMSLFKVICVLMILFVLTYIVIFLGNIFFNLSLFKAYLICKVSTVCLSLLDILFGIWSLYLIYTNRKDEGDN